MKRIDEDDHGNLLVRAAGGFKLHILTAAERQHGNDAIALCGHQPKNRAYSMRRRGKWYYALRPFGHCSCDKCAAAYEKLYP